MSLQLVSRLRITEFHGTFLLRLFRLGCGHHTHTHLLGDTCQALSLHARAIESAHLALTPARILARIHLQAMRYIHMNLFLIVTITEIKLSKLIMFITVKYSQWWDYSLYRPSNTLLSIGTYEKISRPISFCTVSENKQHLTLLLYKLTEITDLSFVIIPYNIFMIVYECLVSYF